MIPYLALLGVTLALLGTGYMTSRRLKDPHRPTFFDLAAVLGLGVFSGLRYGIGTDYSLYLSIWDSRIFPGSWWDSVSYSGQDIGFVGIEFLAKSSGWTFQQFLFAVALATVSFAAAALWMMSPYPRASLCLYLTFAVYLAPMNITRQGLAVALFLFVIALWRRGHRWSLALLPVVIVLHYSSAVALIGIIGISAITSSLRGRQQAMAAIAFGAALFVLSSQLQGLASALNPRYSTYVGTSDVGQGTLFSIAIRVLVVLIAIAVLSKESFKGRNGFEVGAVIAGACFLSLGFTSTEIARFDHYFWPLAAVLVPRIVMAARRKLLLAAVFAAVAACYFIAYLTSFGGLLPYRSAFG